MPYSDLAVIWRYATVIYSLTMTHRK